MKTTLLMVVLSVFVLMAYAGRVAESAGTASGALTPQLPDTVIDLPEEPAVGDRYLAPSLPSSVVDRLPAAEAQADQYFPQRIELAELVVGERILAAEDLATIYARDLPGFAGVLVADGFQQDPDGAWYYDRYSSWMRFPLNR